MSKLAFWRKHFEKHRFRFDKKKFNWDNFREIPFLTKKELFRLGIKERLSDAAKLLKRDPFRAVLMSTSGTTTQTKPMLLVKSTIMAREGGGEPFGTSSRILSFLSPRTLTLRLLLSVFGQTGDGDKSRQLLLVNPFRFKDEMIEAIYQMNSVLIVSFPASFAYLTSTFPKIKKIFSVLKSTWFGGDFLSQKQADSIAASYPNLEINHDYAMGEFDLVGRGCKFLKKRHGLNVYHPCDNRIVELINIDRHGIGELVVSQLDPLEMGYIRYRSGDLAKAVKERCSCGREWMFSLAGRANMDYFKALGTLISRLEIERALKNFDDLIEEWRGEVREVKYRGSFVGELRLILKPYISTKIKKIDVDELRNTISANLRLTPKKTLAMLVREKKFMPLKIEVVDRFPPTAKKVLLRKVLD